MAEQRIMTVHLRKGKERGAPYRATALATKFLRSFVKKHMKAKEVKISREVNDELFRHGGKNPPIRLRVMCAKDDKGTVEVKMVKAAE